MDNCKHVYERTEISVDICIKCSELKDDIENKLILTREEARILVDELAHTFISLENQKLIYALFGRLHHAVNQK